DALKFYALPMLFAEIFIPIPQMDVFPMLVLGLGFAFLAVVASSILEAVSARFKIQHVSGFYLKGVLVIALIQLVIALAV
ncbi:MAG: hypothetical protein ABIF01_03160, partial [Candidatus Micrarchaeota archaeon]